MMTQFEVNKRLVASIRTQREFDEAECPDESYYRNRPEFVEELYVQRYQEHFTFTPRVKRVRNMHPYKFDMALSQRFGKVAKGQTFDVLCQVRG